MARNPLFRAPTPHLLALEPRVMFDAAAPVAMRNAMASSGEARAFDTANPFAHASRHAGAGDPAPATGTPSVDDLSSDRAGATAHVAEPRPPAASAGATGDAAARQVIFIDTSLADYRQLARDWAKEGQVVLIDKDHDGLAQVEAALAGRSGLSAIHIVSHGEEGELLLGSTRLDEAAIAGSQSQALAAIGRSLAPGGDLLVYGCDFAEGADGARALDSLAMATGADVAASTDLTGYAPLGGDWTLEARHGPIEARALSDTAYAHTLAPGPVNAVPIGVAADSLTVKDASGAVVASGANGFTNDGNTDSPNVGVGATARWANAATQNGQSYDLVATVVSITGNDYIRFLRPTGPAANNKPGDDPTFTLYDNSGTNNSTGDGASVQVKWTLVLAGTDTVAPADVTFNILDIDGVNGSPNTRETVSAVASEVYYYTHETGSDIVFTLDQTNNIVSASGTQNENQPIPTNADLDTKSEASYSYQNTSGFTLTYTLAPANTVTRAARFYHDGNSTFVYNTPVYGSIPHLDLDGDDSTETSAPVDTTGAHFTFTEKSGSVPIVDSDVRVTNPMDINSIVSGSVVLTNAKAGDQLNVGTLPPNITAALNDAGGTITVTLSGRGSETDYQNAFRAITYQNNSADPDTTQRVLSVSFTNDANYAAAATSRIDIVAMDDPPVNTLPASYTVGENTALQLTGLSVTDPDAENGNLTVTLSVPNGTLAASTAGGVAVTGSGSGSLTLTGTQAALNSYLASANAPTFTGAQDATGQVSLTMSTTDNGNTGAGGPLTDTDSSTITVTPVNHAPVNSLPANYSATEDGGALSLAGISVSDVDARSGVETITLSVPAGAGTLAATSAGGVTASGSGGNSITLSGTLANLNGYLGSASTRPTFTSAPDFNGVATLTMVTNDNGNTGDGGAKTDTDTSAINVAAVNDAPVNSLPATYTVGEDMPLSLSGISISDVDGGSGVETVTLSIPTGAGSLAATSAGGVTVSGSGGTTLTLAGTVADLNAFLGGASTRPTFTGARDASGPVTLTMTTDDNGNTGSGGALTDTDTSTITVTAVNDPPVNSLPASYSTAEDGGALSLSGISVDDVDAGSGVETVTFSVPAGSGALAAASAGGVTATGSGGTSITLTGTLTDLNAYLSAAATRPTFTGAPDFNGAVTLTMTTDDNGNTGSGGAQSDTDTSTITVTPVNDAPVNTLPASYSGSEDTPLSLNGISVSDVDGSAGTETVTLSVPTGMGSFAAASAAGVTVSGSGGNALTLNGTLADLNAYLGNASTRPTFTGAHNATGPVTLTMATTDNGNTGAGGAKSDTDTSTITLGAVNHPPTAAGSLPARSAQDAQTVSYPTAGGFTDPDGDRLTYSATGLPAGLSIDPATGVISGTLDRSASQPNGGGYSVIVTASDPSGAAATQGFALSVSDPAPTARDDGASTRIGAPVVVTVLANDTDPDGDPLTVTGAGPAGHGAAVVNADGTITYTPTAGFSGSDSFAYTISDGQGGGSSATVTVSVAPDGAPTARPDTATTSPGAPVIVPVLANDSDPDGDPLRVTGASAPNGVVTLNPDGTVTYTPNAGFTGVDTITYAISDGRGGTAGSTVAVTVRPASDTAPRARPDQADTPAGAPVKIDVLANDTDADGDPLTIAGVGAAQHGVVTRNADGTLTYTPDAGFTGADSFDYTVSDGRGGAATATVSVNVGATADSPPAARADAVTTDPGAPVKIAVLANDADPDGDPLTVTGVGPAQHGAVTLNPDGTVTYTPDAGFSGSDSFTYTISDGRGGTAMSVVNVAVGAAADNPPTARRDQAATSPDEPVTIAVLANDSDPDGDPLIVTAASAPNGAVVLNPDGTLTYTPAAGFSGVDTITYTISDGRGGAAVSTATVAVGVVPNTAPVARPDRAATGLGQPVNVAVLGNDTDADGDPLTVTGAGAGAGMVALNPDGTITYTPDAGFSGVDTITYSVADGRGGVATSTVAVTVAGPPTARPDTASVSPGGSTTVDVLANDSGPPGAHLDVVSAVAANGAVTINPDGTLTYAPKAGFRGTDTITYGVSADGGPVALSTVTVSIGSPHRPTADVDTLIAIGRVTFPDPLSGAVEGPPAADAGVARAAAGLSPDLGAHRVERLRFDPDADGERALGLDAGDPRALHMQQAGASSPHGTGLSVHDAVVGARTLADTGIGRQAVGDAVNAIRRLDDTSIDGRSPVAGEVRRLSDDADFRDAGERALDPRWSDFAPRPLSGFSRAAEGDAGVMYNSVVRGGAIYLDVQDIATDGRAPISRFAVAPGAGGALPGWIRVDPQGLAIIERPADVDELHLILEVTRRDGRVIRTPVVIQGATGEIELDRRAAPPAAPEPAHGHRHPQAGERHARLDRTLSTLKAQRRHEAEALHRSFR